MVCPVIDGQRKAIAVSSSEVYNDAKNDIGGDVRGATAPELAKMLYDEIAEAYSIEDSVIRGAWTGTVCDGAYQAAEFASTLKSILKQEHLDDSAFFSVLWDPAHFLNLAFADVFEGKIGTSKSFMDCLVQRLCVVHKIFQQGEMLKHTIEVMSKDDNLVLKVTSRTCSTRFSTSQYVEFRKLLDSLPLHIQTFRQFQFSEVKEYMIAGDDFLFDLCGICDILAPMMEMMVKLQNLSVPCWKIVTWWPKLKSHMERMVTELSLKKPPLSMPLLHKHAAEINSKTFKGTQLVRGWMVVSTENSVNENEELPDVEKELKTFLTDLLASFGKRVTSCTQEVQKVLTCLDLDTIFGLLCGKRLKNGKVKLSGGEGPLELHRRKDFERFYSYICSLPHIKELALIEELSFDPAFANIIFHKMKQALKLFLWKDSGEHLMKWFSLTLPSPARMMKLQKVDQSTDTSVTLEGSSRPTKVMLNEIEVYRSIYTDETLFNSIGHEGRIAIDIALAKGGSEAVVESYYSVMKSQKKFGPQSNTTLALR